MMPMSWRWVLRATLGRLASASGGSRALPEFPGWDDCDLMLPDDFATTL